MLKARVFRWVVILVVVAVGLTIAAVAGSVGPFSGRPHVAPPEHVRQPIPLSQVNPATAADQAKGIYHGPLGEFLVIPGEAAAWPPCPAPIKRTKNANTSELYSPIFGEDLEANTCADGTIIGLTFEIGASRGKRYFVGPAIVPYEAPFDRLVLLTVGGHSAIAELPVPGVPGSLRLTVIERFPAGKQPGILVWIEGSALSLEATAASATKIMGMRP
jgi:hypothetical protein